MAGVRVRWTERPDGDFAVTGDPVDLAERRRRIVDLPWTWLHQVHGAQVVTVSVPGDHAGAAADAAVTATPGAALAIHTADCAPVVLMADGVVGVAHAGWRGLVQGVLQATVDAMSGLGASTGAVRATIGPCIRPGSYAFGNGDLDIVARLLGEEVRAVTTTGQPALDLAAAVRSALAVAGVTVVEDEGRDTAADARLFSHRARGDRGRQACVAWLEP